MDDETLDNLLEGDLRRESWVEQSSDGIDTTFRENSIRDLINLDNSPPPPVVSYIKYKVS